MFILSFSVLFERTKKVWISETVEVVEAVEAMEAMEAESMGTDFTRGILLGHTGDDRPVNFAPTRHEITVSQQFATSDPALPTPSEHSNAGADQTR